MLFSSEVARLKKLTREVLIKEVLREFQGDFEGVVDAINWWRVWRHLTEAEAEHYALSRNCACSICVSIHARGRARACPPRPEPSADWVAEMLTIIDKFTPAMTAAQLKHSLLSYRMFRERTADELAHFVCKGYFLSYTPAQAEAEQRLKEWREARRLRAHAL